MRRKAQYSIMEYLFMMIFVIIIIIALLFVIFIFQFSQIQLEEAENVEARLKTAGTWLLNSPLFVKEEAMFDDAKLTAVEFNEDAVCKNLTKMFGFEVFINITDLNLTNEFSDPNNIDVNEVDQNLQECNSINYGENISGFVIEGRTVVNQCNHWSFCFQDRKLRANVFPVNIYRRIGKVIDTGILPAVDLGRLVIGVYV